MSETFEIVVPEKPMKIEHLVCEALEGQDAYVYIHEENGTTITLNPTASAVFDMCDGRTTDTSMAMLIAETLHVDADVALRDVRDILAELSGFGFFQA